jgi:hypothetical protein
MFTTTIELTRANTDIAWPAEFDAETKAYIKATFKDTGKLLGATTTEGANGLAKTVVRSFVDEAAFAEWQADSTLEAVRIATRRGNDGITRQLQTA